MFQTGKVSFGAIPIHLVHMLTGMDEKKHPPTPTLRILKTCQQRLSMRPEILFLTHCHMAPEIPVSRTAAVNTQA